MPSDLVIQDSDESDAELSDIATSIDPLQDNKTTAKSVVILRDFLPPDQHAQYPRNGDNDDNNQLAEETINGIGSGADLHPNTHGAPSFDPTISVNFDQFLTSQSQDQTATGSVSLSQQRRESAWLGGEDGDGAYPMVMKSPRKSILKRGRTMDAGNTEVDDISVREKNIKRRRTMSVSEAFQGAVVKRVGIAGSREQGEGSYGASEEWSTERMIATESSLSPTKDDGGGTCEEDVPIEDPVAPENHSFTAETIPAPLATGSEAHTQKQPIVRSKSTQGFDDTAYDTELMSSVALARPHRTMSSSFISHPPQSSTESACDELALPHVVQVAITNMRPTAMSEKKQSVAEYAGMESDQDELDCIDFGGIPKERYKPPPSRSRSKAVIDPGMGGDGIGVGGDPYVEVMVPRENFPVAQSCPSREARDSIVAETTKTPERYSLNAMTQDVPLEASKRPLKSAKKKVKRGKTTSAMLKRALESDVEDDVIWMDEKPANVTFKDKENDSLSKSRKVERGEDSKGEPLGNKTESIQEEILPEEKVVDESDVKLDKVQQIPLDPTAAVAAATATVSAPEPKKRGRKRKKTSDGPTMESQLPFAETEQSTYGKKSIQPLAEQDQNIPTLKKAQGEKDSKPDTTTDAGAAEEADQVVQLNEQEQMKPMTPGPTCAPHSPSPQSQLQPQSQSSITTPAPQPVKTPQKTPISVQRGPDKHSPIMINKKASYRVGLSRTAKIAPLLKVVRK
ncbi:hypothetical protein I7I53_00154 [Histoplasma capsulatum var. duboisii H88]|nr:hypothetical protein I7I53_00154 [Histoplasma capsulatum var. duboisii H88]